MYHRNSNAYKFEPLYSFAGEVQQIASQLIELGKKHASSDNISVIVIFLKDPHQIVAEHRSFEATPVTRMDFETTNGMVHLEDTSVVAVHDDDNLSPDKMHVDFKMSDVHTHDEDDDAIEENSFYFGKNRGDEFNSESINAIKSNGDGEQFKDNESRAERSVDDHDDFGPETDVDATDDNVISPLSPSVSFKFDFAKAQ